MTEEFSPFDPAKALDSREAIEYFLADAFGTGDADFIAVALGVVARAEGLEKLAAQTGLSTEALTHALSETGNLTVKTMLSVMKAVGLGLSISPEACTAS